MTAIGPEVSSTAMTGFWIERELSKDLRRRPELVDKYA